jgi:hypothetical protein
LLLLKKLLQAAQQQAMVAQPSVLRRNVCRRTSLSAVLRLVPAWVPSFIFCSDCALDQA